MPCTTPASSSTRRCLVIAWRVSVEPSASREIDCGGPLASLPTSDSRVPSPSAAKTDARCSKSVPRSGRGFCMLLQMACDVRHLLGPPTLVHAEGIEPPVFGKGVEAGFQQEQHGAIILRL